MRTLKATIAAPRGLRPMASQGGLRPMAAQGGLRGSEKFWSGWIDTPEPGGQRLPGARGAVIWAVFTSVLAASTVAFGDPVSTSYIYGIDDASNLWVMALSSDATSGTSQLLGSSVLTAGAANGLAYDSVRDQLFAADTATGDLYWWQQGATNYTSLGIISGTAVTGKVASAAYWNDAYWFLGQGSTGNVLGKLTLNYTNGAPTGFTGETFTINGMDPGASGGGDMVITPAGTLFAFSAPGLGTFFSVDVTTASSGTVGGYNLIGFDLGYGLQLALGTDNTTVFGHDRDTGEWFTIDTTNGNETQQVPGFTTLPANGKGFNDLGGSSVQAVPEPDTLALAAMGGGIVAWQVSRRRRKRGEMVADSDSPLCPVGPPLDDDSLIPSPIQT